MNGRGVALGVLYVRKVPASGHSYEHHYFARLRGIRLLSSGSLATGLGLMAPVAGRYVVTGATGAVGPAVCNRLARDAPGTILALARHQPAAGLLDRSIGFEVADLLDARTIHLVRHADVVLHLAARLHINDPDSRLGAEYERVNIDATRRLVDATPPESRFLFFSTIDIYGPMPDGAIATEETSPKPRSLYSETKLRAERFVLEHPGGLVLRLAAVYGPRVKANYLRLFEAVRRGRYLSIGPGTNVRTMVFEEDVAQVATMLAQQPAPPSRTYNVTDGAVHSVNEIVAAIAAAVGRRPPRWSLPVGVVRGAAVAADRAFRFLGRRSPVTPQMIDKLQENVAVSGDRLHRETGFRPRYDLAAGWQSVVSSRRRANFP